MGQLALFQDRRGVGALSGQVYFYLLLPPRGTLKSIEAVNFTTAFKRIVLSIAPKADYPGVALSAAQAPSSVAIKSGAQGTAQEPVFWQGNLELSSDNCLIMACFRNVVAADTLKLACLVEV